MPSLSVLLKEMEGGLDNINYMHLQHISVYITHFTSSSSSSCNGTGLYSFGNDTTIFSIYVGVGSLPSASVIIIGVDKETLRATRRIVENLVVYEPWVAQAHSMPEIKPRRARAIPIPYESHKIVLE
jgi:hypothetical protein